LGDKKLVCVKKERKKNVEKEYLIEIVGIKKK